MCFRAGEMMGKLLISSLVTGWDGLRSNNRPLYGLKAFSTTIATDINDLPATSPHGK
jgi:hypothetical protein